MANPEHLNWLREGVGPWNERLRQHPFEPELGSEDVSRALGGHEREDIRQISVQPKGNQSLWGRSSRLNAARYRPDGRLAFKVEAHRCESHRIGPVRDYRCGHEVRERHTSFHETARIKILPDYVRSSCSEKQQPFRGGLASNPACGTVFQPLPQSRHGPTGRFSRRGANRMRIVRNQEILWIGLLWRSACGRRHESGDVF